MSAARIEMTMREKAHAAALDKAAELVGGADRVDEDDVRQLADVVMVAVLQEARNRITAQSYVAYASPEGTIDALLAACAAPAVPEKTERCGIRMPFNHPGQVCTLDAGHASDHDWVDERASAVAPTAQTTDTPTEPPQPKHCDTCWRLQEKLTRNETGHLRAMASVQRRVDYLEGTALPHARKQEHANGFQVGWHSALDRICENPNFDELRAQVPDSRPVAPAEPQTPEPELVIECEIGGAEHALAFADAHGLEVAGLNVPAALVSSPEPQTPLEPGRYGTCAGHPSQLVECGYCHSKVAPRDPLHVHGHTECLCGTSPRHNLYLHDRDEKDKRTMIDLVADGKFLANCIKESMEMKNTNVAKLEAMTDSVMELIRPWIKEGAIPDLRYGITRALDSAVSMGGWEKKPTTPNRDNTLAQRLCHEETGLMGDPETAEKVAAWVLLNYTVRDRQASGACDHEWIDIGASVSRCRKCEQLA